MSLSRYDAPTGIYTSSIPVGTRAFRAAVEAHFGFRTEVVRDKTRCGHTRSEHCECGAIDFFVTAPRGRPLFDWCVKHADPLHIQDVIHDRRVIGFGNPTERNYTGPSPHTDHVHVGLDRWARANLTREMVQALLPGNQEDDMTPEQVKELFAQLNKIEKALYIGAEEEVHVVAKKLDDLTAKLDTYMAAHP